MSKDDRRESILRQQQEAALSLAETAVTTPYLFPVYSELEGRKRELAAAKANLERAEAAWLKVLEPAMKNPVFRQLAKERGLLPNVEVTCPQGRGER